MVALLAAALNTPSRVLAATHSARSLTASTINFKGKAVAKNNETHYFVLTFSCSGGSFTGSWTYEVNSSLSYTGTSGATQTQPAPCALIPTDNGMTLSTATSPASTTPSPMTSTLFAGPNNATVGTLTLFLTDVMPSKTFFPNTIAPCPTSPNACIELSTRNLSLAKATDFSSRCLRPPTPPDVACTDLFATLNLSVR
jgi:hypothetical protein